MRQKDIANALNISISTVSRVLNNFPKAASPELSKQIWDLAISGSYKFNLAAQKLQQTKRSFSKGEQKKVILCLYARSGKPDMNTFFENISQGIEYEALKNNYSIVARDSIEKISSNEFIAKYPNYNIQPTIILGRVRSNLLHLFKNPQAPIVQVGLNTNCESVDRIFCNPYSASSVIVRFLHFVGHDCIAYFGETKNELRFQGYRNQLDALGLPSSDQWAFDCPLTKEGGYRACDHFLKNRKYQKVYQKITALFCANDETAIGVFKRIREEGIKIPEDISIISIDNVLQNKTLAPRLTTMQIPKFEMGTMAVQTLISRMNSCHKLPLKIELPFQLIVRDSVLNIKGRNSLEIRNAININFL